MKGTAKQITNIKPMAGGVTIAQLQIGDYAFGDVGATDLMNFNHFYRASGLRVELGAPCKAWLGSGTTAMKLENIAEPNVPPVEPPPPTEGVLIIPDRIVISGIDPVTGSRIDQLIFVK